MYKNVLPNAFPYCVVVGRETARRLSRSLLNEARIDVPDGSSFAVTVDPTGKPNTWHLWLSRVSYDYLTRGPRTKEYLDERLIHAPSKEDIEP